MSTKKQTVIINGKTYDMATGKLVAMTQPVKKSRVINDIAPNRQGILASKPAPIAPAARRPRGVAAHVRPVTQKSDTLRRDILKRPASTIRPNANKVHKHIQKSEHITKFTPAKTEATSTKKPSVDTDLVAQTRALEKAHAEHVAAVAKNHAPIGSRIIKEHLLKQAVEKTPAHEAKHHITDNIHVSRRARFTSVTLTSLALLLLGGYLTYTNIPNLSIRIAAANAGINASLPQYQPAGYRIHGPISYQEGEVNVSYKQSGSNLGYKISQRPTDWDPIAALDNYVESDSKDNYQTHSVQGLTVYTYDKKAVWVNGGILHVLDGNAPLSNQQVERIVASM